MAAWGNIAFLWLVDSQSAASGTPLANQAETDRFESNIGEMAHTDLEIRSVHAVASCFTEVVGCVYPLIRGCTAAPRLLCEASW